jgi:cytochrome c553
MQPFAAGLSDTDIKNFAAYFDKLERGSNPQGVAFDQKKIQQGARIAELAHNTRLMPACQSCHVKDNPKRLSDIPDLAGQPARYLTAQLKLFRSGTRANTPNAKIMARIAQGLSDADIENVSTYFAALSAESREVSKEHTDPLLKPGPEKGGRQ